MKPEQTLECITIVTAMKEMDVNRLKKTYPEEYKEKYVLFWKQAEEAYGQATKTRTPEEFIYTYWRKMNYAKNKIDELLI